MVCIEICAETARCSRPLVLTPIALWFSVCAGEPQSAMFPVQVQAAPQDHTLRHHQLERHDLSRCEQPGTQAALGSVAFGKVNLASHL